MRKWNASTLWVPHNNGVNLTLGRFTHPNAQPAQVTPNTLGGHKNMESDLGQRVELGAVPETLLWTLFNRATEARRPDSVLHDPQAVHLIEAIDFPFETRFGAPHWSQAQALRALQFDEAVDEFLAFNPDGTVVALGEGLETQFWRVDNGRVHWVTVDLPEVIELRRRLLPAPPRLTALACSALDTRWFDAIDPASPLLITAQGLLMYLRLDDVRALIGACADAFPGGRMVFDAVPRWLSRSTTDARPSGANGYVAPPMLWGMDVSELVSDAGLHPPGVEAVELDAPRGRGLFFAFVLPLLSRIPRMRETRLPFFPWVIVSLTFPSRTV
jgi:O-methyltransferase involved in polyketide biosynthesis